MKSKLWIILAIVLCLVLAIGAYFWATGVMDSFYAYRSPLQYTPPSPGEPLGQPLARRVVFVLIDALREDTSLNADAMPFLNELREQGASATMHSRPPSYSAPGYSVLLTGAWPDLSDGPALNLEYEEIPTFTQDDLISSISRAGLTTAISAFNWFEKLVPQSSVSAGFYTAGEDNEADREVVDAALSWLRDGSQSFVLIHLDQVDYAGHYEGGPLDPRWDEAAGRADDLLREIVATLDLSQDALLVCSDHGQIDRGGHGGQDAVVLVEPFVLVGAGVRPGHYGDVKMVDVAPTLSAMLGAGIPASSQGHVLAEMLLLSEDQLQVLEDRLVSQQGQLLSLYQTAIGRQIAVQPGEDVVATHQLALESSHAARLNAERLPRALLALALLVLCAAVIFRTRGSGLAWLLGGALLYLVLFNLRYAVLDGRTYSLSSVASADELIAYSAVTALLAMLGSWLVTTLGLKAFRRGPRRAGGLVLGLTLLVLFLLSLPVLYSYVLNGVLVTWTLPHMSSMFLGFISLIQMLLVSVVGLLLTGLTALIARFVPSGRKAT